MEGLLDQADALAANQETLPRPDFDIPEQLIHNNHLFLEVKDTPSKGRGYVAKQDIPVGTIVMAEKPIALVMNYEDEQEEEPFHEEDDEEMDAEPEPRIHALLLHDLLRKITEHPSIWTDALTHLFPRDSVEDLHVTMGENEDILLQTEQLLKDMNNKAPPQIDVPTIAQRLPLVIRYNVLSVETAPELLSHPTTHSILSGVGLYHRSSFFNHSAKPNCNRFAIGDVMFFVANQNIPAGTEVCISYIEHDVLCESAYRRNLMLHMDFEEPESEEEKHVEEEEDGPEIPVVDTDVQNELMSMELFDRIDAIDELLQQALGEKSPGEDTADGDMEEGGEAWFQCDVNNLRILKALTLDAMGQHSPALALWEQVIDFTQNKLPPNDENGVVAHAQAALTAMYAGENELAKTYATKAVEIHHAIFGGGLSFFRRRLRNDFELNFRPSTSPVGNLEQSVEFLWPC